MPTCDAYGKEYDDTSYSESVMALRAYTGLKFCNAHLDLYELVNPHLDEWEKVTCSRCGRIGLVPVPKDIDNRSTFLKDIIYHEWVAEIGNKTTMTCSDCWYRMRELDSEIGQPFKEAELEEYLFNDSDVVIDDIHLLIDRACNLSTKYMLAHYSMRVLGIVNSILHRNYDIAGTRAKYLSNDDELVRVMNAPSRISNYNKSIVDDIIRELHNLYTSCNSLEELAQLGNSIDISIYVIERLSDIRDIYNQVLLFGDII